MNSHELEKLIKEYITQYMSDNKTRTVWKEPLFAYADAHDDMFVQLKHIIGGSHATPEDLLEDAQTVVTYFVPFEEAIVKGNIPDKYCSKAWAAAYIETNKLIEDVNLYVHYQLNRCGFTSSIIPPTHNFDRQKLVSDWSHRHIAYFAGLGTFGLNNMLITEKGCCGRIGSFVTNLRIKPTLRKEQEYCLFKSRNICKKCVERCVNGALRTDSFDRHKCYEMCLINDEYHSDMELSDVCGKCLAGVPCSFKSPGTKGETENEI